jgi:hypothetical protein
MVTCGHLHVVTCIGTLQQLQSCTGFGYLEDITTVGKDRHSKVPLFLFEFLWVGEDLASSDHHAH